MSEVELLERVIRRLLETNGECSAVVMVQNLRTGEWFPWDTCTGTPGHPGDHESWSDRDMAVWATWADGGSVDAAGLRQSGAPSRTEPSPWSQDEIDVLIRLGNEVPTG